MRWNGGAVGLAHSNQTISPAHFGQAINYLAMGMNEDARKALKAIPEIMADSHLGVVAQVITDHADMPSDELLETLNQRLESQGYEALGQITGVILAP